MRAVLQRVARAKVTVESETGGPEVTGQIDRGLLVLLGVAAGDPPGAEELLARKTAELRIFPDDEGKMNRSVIEAGGSVLVVSQFTLLADCKKGRRPSFLGAAPPAEADARYQRYCELLRGHGLKVETGRFQTEMQVELVNQGPVTIVLDTRDLLKGGEDA